MLLITTLGLYAQKEANNWYFGINAGIKFNDDGSVSPLDGGQTQTNEGCSSISDPEGNLLFYSDGRTVWDRNHVIMPNGNYFGGTGLLGDPSSTQSCIIVPKKDNPNIYYIFTVDEPHHQNAAVYPNQFNGIYNDTNAGVPEQDDGFNNGLNYSVVDLSVIGANGSIGDVITRNVQLVTYDPTDINQIKYKCSEKVTAVKNGNGSGFWVISQFIDKFYAFEVTAAGVNTTPVVTQTSPSITIDGYRRNAIGCIRVSPNGNYIAIAHRQNGTVTGGTSNNNGSVYLYNFDKTTGIVSNPVQVVQNQSPYGIEFSPDDSRLYVSYEDSSSGNGELWQFTITDPSIANTTGIRLSADAQSTTLQLGPNGKIYKAVNGGSALDVINNPDALGLACDYQASAVPLPAGSASIFGLPPFITSLFSASIQVKLTCFGSSTKFSLYTNKQIQSVVWDFGDGSATVTDNAPQHTYAAPGNYSVTAVITHQDGTETVEKDITITVPPVANITTDMVICDADTDGIASVNLSGKTAEILGSQNPADFTVYYYASQQDAIDNTSPLNATDYTNTVNPQVIYTRVVSNVNRDCYALGSFNLIISGKPAINVAVIAACDDITDGNDNNGSTTFNLTASSGTVIANSDFSVTWHATQTDADNNANPLPANYYAATGTTVYVRAIHNTYGCVYTYPVNLAVRALPPVVTGASLSQCDPQVTPDGITQFNLTEADSQFTAGNTSYRVRYFTSVTDAEQNLNEITGGYTNAIAYTDTVTARVENIASGCYRLLTLNLTVTTASYAPITLSECDEVTAEDGFKQFNLADAGYETAGNTVTYYSSEQDALLEQNALPVLFTNTVPNYQTVYARIENNNACLAIAVINLQVYTLPNIVQQDTGIVCLNTGDYITLTAGISGSQYSYVWSTGATTQFISVNTPGVYSVVVTNTTTGCNKTRTITVTPSNVATINDIEVTDLTENNTVTIIATPTGGVDTTYLYSLDAPNGPWQAEPLFENVAAGIHTIYVYDTKGCGIVKRNVGVLQIPNFFTPNGDGTNDYWHIPGIAASNYYNSRIYIFDRYGKLVAGLPPYSQGWDGTLNGHPLPSTDYWYVIELTDGRIIKGHFSLIR